jgi:hypothetical protein
MGFQHISLLSLGILWIHLGKPLAEETSNENGILHDVLFSEGASLEWEIILVHRLK